MSLSRAPGVWRWEERDGKWWHVHDVLNIEDGPHFGPDVDCITLPNGECVASRCRLHDA